MAYYGYLQHDDPAPPVSRTAHQRLEACGYPFSSDWGENIAYQYTTPEDTMAGWLNSPPHLANIEKATFTVTGTGVAVAADGTYYWTLIFGVFDDSVATPTPTPSPTPTGTPGNVTMTPNSPYTAGLNGVVVQGGGRAVDVTNAIASSSGRTVRALWMFRSGSWQFYLPALPAVDGGLAIFPVASAFAVLS